jgi:hypothetical protein
VGLHVGVLGAEQPLRPVDGQGLRLVDELVAAVVALARVALRVLVGEHRPDRPHTAGEVKFSLAMSWIVVFCRSSSRG